MKKVMITVGWPVVLALTVFSGTAITDDTVHVVDIKQGTNRFSPEIITIEKGGTVRWINNDSAQPSHDFASVPGPKKVNKELKVIELVSGQVAEHTFNEPGVYDYFCYIHKGMVGRVIVK